jgi:hypothetical protein
MDIPLNHLNYIEMWTKPIIKHHISPDIEETIELMASQTIYEHRVALSNIKNRIIQHEYRKHPVENLRKRLLIKNQIVNNLTENIKTLTINIAKEKYDMEQYKYYEHQDIINFEQDYSLIPYDINVDSTYNINPSVENGYILFDNTYYDNYGLQYSDLENGLEMDCDINN